MIKTDVLFDQEARSKFLKGIDIVCKSVGTTLGPRGQNVAIAKTNPRGEIYERIVLHDGVSVARSIELLDEFENMGAQLIIQAARKQVDEVGDGTTVTIILAHAIIQEAFKYIASGFNPMELRSGLESGLDLLIDEILSQATPITTEDQLTRIATISAEDEKIGNLVAGTLTQATKDGIITVEESKNAVTTVEFQKGMQFDTGFYHPLFITHPEHMEAILHDARFLVTDKSLLVVEPLMKLLEELWKQQDKLVIIAPEIGGDVLPTLLQNKLKGKLSVLCIKAPSFGQNQKEFLQDIALFVGAKFITEDAGHKIEDITISHLGKAESIVSTKSGTIITGGSGDSHSLQARVDSIKKQIEEESGEFDKEKLKERLAKLTNGVAVIRVGGATEVEMKERRERVLDSVAATRAALESGIVPGGEMIYFRIRHVLNKEIPAHRILEKALLEPFYRLISNAGIDQFSSGMSLALLDNNYGIDVTSGEPVDLVAAGIIDPALVPLNALTNAVSVAIQILTSSCIIVPKVREERK